MAVRGIQGLSTEQLSFEIQRGGKFVIYQYCVSVLILTFKRGTDVHFIRAGESRLVPGLAWTFLTLLLGWWGIPWGPIYSIQTFIVNFSGGKDVTALIVPSSRPVTAAGAAAAKP